MGAGAKYFLNRQLVAQQLKRVGNSETPDTTAVTALDKDESGNITFAKGTTVPTDAESGFAVGCVFIDTNAAAGAMVFINEGSTSSCDFNAIGTLSNVIDGIVAGNGLTGDATEGTATLAVGEGAGISVSADAVAVDSEVRTDLITLALAGTMASASFPFNAEVETEQAAALAVVDDGGVQALLSVSGGEAGYTANYQLFPDTEAEDDAAYFGGANPFGVLVFDVDTVATYGADSLAWEYWDGSAWQTLTIVWDETDTTANDGLQSFQQDGAVIFSAPTDWASTTVNGQVGYWVRARVIATANITQIPTTNSVEHKLVSDPVASEMTAAGTIGRGRLSFVTVSGANNDTKIILVNLTKGTCSAVKTLTQALAANEVADFALACDAGDQLAVYCTQEDGTTEFANGWMELSLVKTG